MILLLRKKSTLTSTYKVSSFITIKTQLISINLFLHTADGTLNTYLSICSPSVHPAFRLFVVYRRRRFIVVIFVVVRPYTCRKSGESLHVIPFFFHSLFFVSLLFCIYFCLFFLFTLFLCTIPTCFTFVNSVIVAGFISSFAFIAQITCCIVLHLSFSLMLSQFLSFIHTYSILRYFIHSYVAYVYRQSSYRPVMST